MRLGPRHGRSGASRASYTRCGEPAVYDDVEYLPSAMLKGARADVAVAWRFPPLLDLVEAPSKFVWAHDPTLQATRAAHRVVALSEWHRKSILKASPVLKPDQVTVIGGAIRVGEFATVAQPSAIRTRQSA